MLFLAGMLVLSFIQSAAPSPSVIFVCATGGPRTPGTSYFGTQYTEPART